MDLSRTVFGTSTLKEESAGSIVSPQKSSSEVEKEYNVGKELYKKVHVKGPTLLSPIHPQPPASQLDLDLRIDVHRLGYWYVPDGTVPTPPPNV